VQKECLTTSMRANIKYTLIFIKNGRWWEKDSDPKKNNNPPKG